MHNLPPSDRAVRRLVRATVLLACFGTLSCTRDAEQAYDAIFSEPVKLNSVDRREFRLTQEGGQYKYPDIESPDGTVTRVIWLQAGQGPQIIEMTKGHPAMVALKQIAQRPAFFTDALDKTASNEGLMLVGTREAVDNATYLVTHILTSLPLIEIEARIVEVRESDEFGFGTDLFLLDRDDHAFSPANPGAPLSPSTTLFDRARTSRGLPALPGSCAIAPGASPLLMELGPFKATSSST